MFGDTLLLSSNVSSPQWEVESGKASSPNWEDRSFTSYVIKELFVEATNEKTG